MMLSECTHIRGVERSKLAYARVELSKLTYMKVGLSERAHISGWSLVNEHMQ